MDGDQDMECKSGTGTGAYRIFSTTDVQAICILNYIVMYVAIHAIYMYIMVSIYRSIANYNHNQILGRQYALMNPVGDQHPKNYYTCYYIHYT